MPLPELMRRKAEKLLDGYCRAWTPCYTEDPLRLTYRIEGETITLLMRSLAAGGDSGDAAPFAQLRFCPELQQWTLHVPTESGRWRFYLNTQPSLNLERLLQHLDEDPLGFFRF